MASSDGFVLLGWYGRNKEGTAKEAAFALGWREAKPDKYNKAGGRVGELENRGLVASGERRACRVTKRVATVYAITAHGREHLRRRGVVRSEVSVRADFGGDRSHGRRSLDLIRNMLG